MDFVKADLFHRLEADSKKFLYNSDVSVCPPPCAGFGTGGLGAVGKTPQLQQMATGQPGSQSGGAVVGANGLGISFGSNSGMESLWGPLSLSKQSSTSSFWNPHPAESEPVVPDSLQVGLSFCDVWRSL